jgi:hypothetical protein
VGNCKELKEEQEDKEPEHRDDDHASMSNRTDRARAIRSNGIARVRVQNLRSTREKRQSYADQYQSKSPRVRAIVLAVIFHEEFQLCFYDIVLR